jgi:hypothetical protein
MTEMSPNEDRSQPADQGSLDRLLLILIGIFGLALVPAAIAWLALRVVSTPEAPLAVFPDESFPAQGLALGEYRRDMESRLHDLGWIDREKGIVHVPIDLGMQLLLAHGLPAREEAPGGARKQ